MPLCRARSTRSGPSLLHGRQRSASRLLLVGRRSGRRVVVAVGRGRALHSELSTPPNGTPLRNDRTTRVIITHRQNCTGGGRDRKRRPGLSGTTAAPFLFSWRLFLC